MDFDTFQPFRGSEELRNGGPAYRSSLSALENAWGHAASTKENLDTVDRRITKAKNYYPDDGYNADNKANNTKMRRKYSDRKRGKVQLNLNPEIKYQESEDVDDLLIADRDPLRPRRHPLFGERSPRSAKEQYELDFQYDPDDNLFSERLRSPVIPKLNSSIGGKSLGDSIRDSGSLARLRKKIQQQKENLHSPELQAPFAAKVSHGEADPVIAKETTFREPMKRKVASMSSAPAYKGFNLPEAKDRIAQTTRLADIQSRKLVTHQQRKERVGSLQTQNVPGPKSNLPGNKKTAKKTGKNSPGKMQRIVAQRKPMPSITTTSWRLGQEAVKKALGTIKTSKERKPVVEKIESDNETRTDDVFPSEVRKISDSESREMSTASKITQDSSEATQTKQSTSNDKSDSRTHTPIQDEDTEMKTDKEDDNEDLKNLSKDLSMHEDLPEEAKSMLAELQMEPSDDSDNEVAKPETAQPEPVKQKKTAGIKKNPKRKAPATAKDRSEQENYNRPKIRHYDQEAVQNYMAKQLAERKKKKLQDKRRQQQLKLEQEKKLMELYEKQKSSLKASLVPKRKNAFGSTFTSQDGKASLNQNKLQADTAIKKFVAEDLKGSQPMTSSPETLHSTTNSRASTYDVSSPMKPRNEENVDETGEIESEFKDSLEFDTSGNHMLGIRNITVKKTERDLISDKLVSQAPARSVEDEVRELIEKYRANIASKPEKVEKALAPKIPDTARTKEQRIAAISATANSLRERIAAEASRLDNLRMLSKRDKTPPPQTTLYSGFRGALPGVANIDEQAGLNQELKEKEEAATKIQAIFRGHSVRQGLDWKLPSGKSFGASLRDAREQSKQAILKTSIEESSRASSTSSYTSAFEAGSDVSLTSEETGSTASLIDLARKPGSERRAFEAKKYARPQFKSLLKSERHSKYKEAPKDRKEYVEDIMKKGGGDRYSVINILARRLKEANKQVIHPKDRKAETSSIVVSGPKFDKDHLSVTEDDIYEQDFEDAEYDTSSSTIKTDVTEDNHGFQVSDKPIDELSRNLSQRSFSTERSLSKSNTKIQEINSDDDPDRTLTLFQEDLHDNETSVKVESYISGQHDSDDSATAISPPHSPHSLTEGSVDLEKQPVFTSTLRQPTDQQQLISDNHETDTSMTVSVSETPDQFSPGTLERRLRAEVNQLETMDDALRQVTDIERVRAISLAQQETVSLAQMLKARQLGYQQELEKMSQLAREQAISKAQELEKVEEAAAKSAENAAKTIAEVRKEAADAIMQSKRKCEEVHEEANQRAEKAALDVEKAQRIASDVILESANRYSSNIETMAASAASAAASSAVQTALQIHKEQLEELRKEALNKVSRSYSRSTISTTSTRSSSEDTTLTKSPSADELPSHLKSYGDEEFEEFSPEKSSVADRSDTASRSRSSIRDVSSSAVKSKDKTKSFSQSIAESISEEVSEQISSESKAGDASKTPVTSKKSYHDALEESLQASSDVDEKSFKFEDHLASSWTEDELDAGFRMVLPVVSHRRKSLEKDRRSRHDKQFSDNGTSSDEMKLTPHTIAKHAIHSPFVGEDTFSEFTSGMVKQYLQEEEIRSKHQTALLKLREKALIEKTKAEMAWLELKKSSLKDKGADDQMPPLNKKQRGLLLKLQSDQSEIRRLRQAYRAASHERKFMLYQQKEVLRLKQNTQKIWNKLGQMKAGKKDDEIQKAIENKSISEASSLASIDQSSIISEELSNAESQISKKATSSHPRTASATPTQTRSTKKDNLSSDSTGEIQEEIPSEQMSASKDQSSFPSYDNTMKSSKTTPERKSQSDRILSRTQQTPTEDVSISERSESSMIADLKKLKKKASEEYLLKREKTLKERQNQFESVLQKQNEMSDWQKRIEREEMRLKAEIKRALDKTKTRITTPTISSSKRSNEESSESTRKSKESSSQNTTTQTKESDTSITEDLKTASIETDSELPLESIASEPGSVKKASDSSVVDEYVDESFESPSATRSQTKKESPKSGSRQSSSPRTPSSRRYSKESDESRSEEDTVADATSDASDVERRIRQLEDELIRRRKDLDRIRKKREKDQLRKKEQRLKQELQAVESLISIENKENLNDRSIGDASSFIKAPVSPKILSPKILQQSNLHDQNATKKAKESTAKTHAERKDSDEVQPDSEQLSPKSQTKSTTNNAGGDALRRTEMDLSRTSQAKSISEELDALRSIKDTSAEERARSHSDDYDYDDFESEHSRASGKERSMFKEPSVSKSHHESSKVDSISESIVSEIDEKPADSVSSEIKSEISERSNSASQASQKRDTTHTSANGTPRSSIPQTDLSQYSKHESEITKAGSVSEKVRAELTQASEERSEITASLNQKVKPDYASPRSESIHSALKSIDSDESISERVLDASKASGKESKGGSNIYDDDFFESSLSVASRSGKATVASRVDLEGGVVNGRSDQRTEEEEKSIREDISAISESIKSASSKTVSSRSLQSDAKLSNGVIDQSTSALSKYDQFKISDKVTVDDALRGTIRFIGKTSFSPVVVAGIQLDEKLGNTDGSFRGKRYFDCPSDFGLFSPIKNIALCKDAEGRIEAPEALESSAEEVDDIVSEEFDGSAAEDHDSKRSTKFELVSKSESIKEDSQKSRPSTREGEYSSRESSPKQSYQDIAYHDDFEDVTDSKRQELSSKQQSKASITEEISENISAHADISKSSDRSAKDEATSLVLGESVEPRESSLVDSEAETSEEELVPAPPRIDVDKLADNVTESLLKKLLVESLQIKRSEVQEDQSVSKLDSAESWEEGGGKSANVLSFGKGSSKSVLQSTDEDVSEEIVESLSEKSDDTIKRMTVRGLPGQFNREEFEINEAYITPSVSDASISAKAGDKSEEDTTRNKLKALDQLTNGDLDEIRAAVKREGDFSVKVDVKASNIGVKVESRDRGAEKEVDKVTKTLLTDAISHMIKVMQEKQGKLSSEVESQKPPVASQASKQHDHSSPILVNVIVKNKDGIVVSPTDAQSPPEPRLDDAPLAFDTDLLAAKLSELKKMDQEIDDLLGEDSEEDEPFALPGDRDILQLADDETDLIPPVRDFEFGEPMIRVPHTIPEVNRLVSESANRIISKLVHSENYEILSPSDSYLQSDTENSDFENSSNLLYKRMIFDVTKDLFKEAKEFKSIQTVAKQPWSKPSRRVFAKFIRQIHHLTGQDLIKSLQKHVCVCLGLEDGRPSLDVLKKRLPLNTAKKDYIDALLVEELREEEPQWVNYDEDELRVKDQLTQGILDSLIDETCQLIKDIQTSRGHLEDLV